MVAAAVAGILSYFRIEPNAIEGLPEKLQIQAEKAVKSTELDLDTDKYFKEGDEAFSIYQAALLLSRSHSKDAALKKSIAKALENKDFKLAVVAAHAIDRDHTKDNELLKIAEAAIAEQTNIGYAIIAADLAVRDHYKDRIVNLVISKFEGEDVQAVSHPALVPLERINSSDLTDFEKYKIIFHFADSRSYMNLSEEQAKVFVESWLETKTYEEFLYFREVFIFAEARSFIDLDSDEAALFAEQWIAEGYTKADFEVFKEAFAFAHSSSAMDMSEEDAVKFAYEKVAEHKRRQ